MNKYNDWCHKKPLISNFDLNDYAKITTRINQYQISAFSKSALQQKEFLKVDGFEFVAFSNLKIDKNIIIENGFFPKLR